MLRMRAPRLHERYLADCDRQLQLAQAEGFRFLQWLEQHADRRELMEACARVIASGPAKLAVELRASAACVGRNYTPRPDAEPMVELDGERVELYAPSARVAHPQAHGLDLDAWTARALEGADVAVIDPEPATMADLARVHDRRYLHGLQSLPDGQPLTPETVVWEGSLGAALASSGAVIAAVRQALSDPHGAVRFCQTRPGSHHAETARARGTCLINHLAVAAAWALRKVSRVVILDIDAHHGNGSEEIFLCEPRVFTVSAHQAGAFFPGTGSPQVIGRGHGAGRNLNRPVRPQESWGDAVVELIRAVERFSPQLVLVELSADAHRSDPVSDLQASDADFAAVAGALRRLNCPVVWELGASLSERAWVGALRAVVHAASRSARS